MTPINAADALQGGPDLLVPPHVLAVLMQLFAGEPQLALLQQEQLCAHLEECAYCRTAVVFLLGIAQECDCRANDSVGPALALRMRFARISGAIEARAYERMGAYAEALVAEGRAAAARRFSETAAHLGCCASCRLALEATVAFLNESSEID